MKNKGLKLFTKKKVPTVESYRESRRLTRIYVKELSKKSEVYRIYHEMTEALK